MQNRSRPPGVICQPQDTVSSLSGRIVREARRAEPLSADGWYDLGVDLEACAPDEAREAYHRALAMDSRHAEAHVNLGRLLQEAGLRVEAASHYRSALEAKPGYPTAAFNLGTALEELGRPGEAMAAYRRAVEADAEFADAHFNLSRLYERAGKRAAALRHLRTYKLLSEQCSEEGTMKVLIAAREDAYKQWKGSSYLKELPAGDALRFSAGRLRTP
jgi:tetratricopeptide (TPR) repeat protein